MNPTQKQLLVYGVAVMLRWSAKGLLNQPSHRRHHIASGSFFVTDDGI